MTTPTQSRPRVYWRLRAIMAERNVASIAALRRKLSDHYPIISDVQLGRIVSHLPERMNMSLLVALCHALDCSPHDLLYWGTSPPSLPAANTSRPSAPRPVPTQQAIERLRGPSFKVFSNITDEMAP